MFIKIEKGKINIDDQVRIPYEEGKFYRVEVIETLTEKQIYVDGECKFKVKIKNL